MLLQFLYSGKQVLFLSTDNGSKCLREWVNFEGCFQFLHYIDTSRYNYIILSRFRQNNLKTRSFGVSEVFSKEKGKLQALNFERKN